MNALETPRMVIRRHSRSFSLAARLLAPGPRARAENLYAWCRGTDDAIDLAATRNAALSALNELHESLDAIYAGRAIEGPAARALASVVRDCALPRKYPEELLAGMAMDVLGTRYETAGELELYCHRVAGVVGLMMCHALGVRDDRALPHAAHLGIAMQLTNVARDVAEDWSRGRLYLPHEWLAGTITEGEPLDDAITAPAIRRVLQLADRYYASGDRGLHYLDSRSRIAIQVARRVYSAIGERIARNGYRASAGRAVVSDGKKAWLALGSVAKLSWRGLVEARGTVRAPRATWDFEPLRSG
jgi:phytoene synthase